MDSESKFVVGDIVRVIGQNTGRTETSGPIMTVQHTYKYGKDQRVDCVWWDSTNSRFRNETFTEGILERGPFKD